jgi:hypothetical protein
MNYSYAIIFTNRWTNRKIVYPQLFDVHMEAFEFMNKEIRSHLYSDKNWKDHKILLLIDVEVTI